MALFRYDKDLDGRLNFDEFKSLILPSDSNYSDLVMRRPAYCTYKDFARMEFFLDTTSQKLKSCLQLVLNTEMRCERVRQDLARDKNFDLEKAFTAVALSVDDKPTTGDGAAVTKDDISSFLISKNFAATQRQVALFFMRLDKYGTGEPKLQDWKSEMTPRTEV